MERIICFIFDEMAIIHGIHRETIINHIVFIEKQSTIETKFHSLD